MSNIYVTEPATFGKVVLKTTVGEVEIELWAKETPKACRNFVQLCMEGYYDDTAFHRLVRGFIVQGGDPTGKGDGGESIYGQPFKTEVHSRLNFNRRGLVGMACLTQNENASQFFFTLGAAHELTGKHTLFGRVVGDTLYNMLRLGEGDVGPNERPVRLHRIVNTKVILNPYDDIVPRKLHSQKTQKSAVDQEPKVTAKATKNFSLLSFGEEAEEEEQLVSEVSEKLRNKGKSAHDLLSDPRLSSIPVSLDNSETAALIEKAANETAERRRRREQAMLESGESTEEIKAKRIDALRKEAEALRKEIIASKRSEARRRDQLLAEKENATRKASERAQAEAAALARWESREPDTMAHEPIKDTLPVTDPDTFEAALAGYKAKSRKVRTGAAREEATLSMLASFSARLHAAVAASGAKTQDERDDLDAPNEEELGSASSPEISSDSPEQTLAVDKWMSAKLISEIPTPARQVLDPTVPHPDRYDLYDPRNPLNVRKRGGDQPGQGSEQKRSHRF